MKLRFEEISTRIAPTLKRITHRLNGHFTYFDDDDLYQEATVHLLTDYNAGVLDDKTDSYILQGCYFHLKNHIRTATDRVRFVSISSSIDDDTELESLLPDDNAARRVFDGLERSVIDKEAASCGLNERELRVMDAALEGKTVREIGKELGISHVMIVKIRSRIRARLEPLRKEFHGGYQK